MKGNVRFQTIPVKRAAAVLAASVWLSSLAYPQAGLAQSSTTSGAGQGAWVFVSGQKLEKPAKHQFYKNSATAAATSGTIAWSYRDGAHSCTASWIAPPRILRSGDKIKLTFSVRISGSGPIVPTCNAGFLYVAMLNESGKVVSGRGPGLPLCTLNSKPLAPPCHKSVEWTVPSGAAGRGMILTMGLTGHPGRAQYRFKYIYRDNVAAPKFPVSKGPWRPQTLEEIKKQQYANCYEQFERDKQIIAFDNAADIKTLDGEIAKYRKRISRVKPHVYAEKTLNAEWTRYLNQLLLQRRDAVARKARFEQAAQERLKHCIRDMQLEQIRNAGKSVPSAAAAPGSANAPRAESPAVVAPVPAPQAATPSPTARPAPQPVGAVKVLAIDNKQGVRSGPSAASRFRTRSPIYVRSIRTYHWNGGRGTPPGTIALRSEDGKLFGPWQASGQANNVYWIVNPHMALPAGTYTIVDSDPATWATNAAAGNRGIYRLEWQSLASSSPAASGAQGSAGNARQGMPQSGNPYGTQR